MALNCEDAMRAGGSVYNGDMLLGALRWGLSVAPLTVVILYMVGYTPSAVGREQSYPLYMACLAGALVGLGITLAVLVRARCRAKALAVCHVGLLELSWMLLTVGLQQGRRELTVVGVALASATCAGLAALWFLPMAGSDAHVELGGCAVALLAGFIIYALVTMTPVMGWATFALPLLTGIPLIRFLREKPLEAVRIVGLEERGLDITRLVLVGVLALLMGSCLGILGFGAPQVDYSVAVAGIVLAIPLAWRGPQVSMVGRLGAPLAIAGLCVSLGWQGSLAFSLFLAGCVCLATGVVIDAERADGLVGVIRMLALLCGGAMAGLTLIYGLVALEVLAPERCALAIVVGLAFAGAALEMAGDMGGAEVQAASDVLALRSARALASAYGLSQREFEVARYVCENRGVGFISQRLGLAPSTVKTHVQHIYGKTGVHSKDELQLLAEELGRGD